MDWDAVVDRALQARHRRGAAPRTGQDTEPCTEPAPSAAALHSGAKRTVRSAWRLWSVQGAPCRIVCRQPPAACGAPTECADAAQSGRRCLSAPADGAPAFAQGRPMRVAELQASPIPPPPSPSLHFRHRRRNRRLPSPRCALRSTGPLRAVVDRRPLSRPASPPAWAANGDRAHAQPGAATCSTLNAWPPSRRTRSSGRDASPARCAAPPTAAGASERSETVLPRGGNIRHAIFFHNKSRDRSTKKQKLGARVVSECCCDSLFWRPRVHRRFLTHEGACDSHGRESPAARALLCTLRARERRAPSQFGKQFLAVIEKTQPEYRDKVRARQHPQPFSGDWFRAWLRLLAKMLYSVPVLSRRIPQFLSYKRLKKFLKQLPAVEAAGAAPPPLNPYICLWRQGGHSKCRKVVAANANRPRALLRRCRSGATWRRRGGGGASEGKRHNFRVADGAGAQLCARFELGARPACSASYLPLRPGRVTHIFLSPRRARLLHPPLRPEPRRPPHPPPRPTRPHPPGPPPAEATPTRRTRRRSWPSSMNSSWRRKRTW